MLIKQMILTKIKKQKAKKIYVVKQKLKFEDYKQCLEVNQLQNKINKIEKNKVEKVEKILEKTIKNS